MEKAALHVHFILDKGLALKSSCINLDIFEEKRLKVTLIIRIFEMRKNIKLQALFF